MSGPTEGAAKVESIAPKVSARLVPAVLKALDGLDVLGQSYHDAIVKAMKSHRDIPPDHESDGQMGTDLAPEKDRYSANVADRVLGPLVGSLRRLDTGSALEEGWMAVQNELSAAVRYASSVRFGASREELERVVRYHATVRLPEALRPLFLERSQRLGMWGNELERGARGWWEALLGKSDSEADGDASDPVTDARVVLDEAFEIVSNLEWPSVRQEAAEVLDVAEAALSEDLERSLAGRFKRKVGSSGPVPWEDVVPANAHWGDWHREVASRVALEVTLIRVRAGLFGLATAEIDGMWTAAAEVARLAEENGTALRALADEFRDLCGAEGVPSGAELEGWRDRCLVPLENELVPAAAAFATSDAGPGLSGDRMADGAYRFVATQPETFVVHKIDEGGDPDPAASPITFEFRRAVAQCVDALLIERLRESARGVIESAERGHVLAREIPAIVRSAFAALGEALESGETVALDGEDVITTIPDALGRAAGVSEQLRELVLESFPAWEEEARGTIDVGWVRLTQRASVSSGVGEQWAGLRSGASIAVRESLGGTAQRVAGWNRNLLGSMRKAWGVARRLFIWLEQPEAMSGAAVSSPEVDFLARADELGSRLPLVYRRLFASDGMREPSLLVAQEDYMKRLEAGAEGLRQRALLLVADPGAGLSSLFHAVASDPAFEKQIVHVELTERIENEAGLLTAFANVGIVDHGFGIRGIGAQIAEQSSGGKRPLVLVEGLERAFLRRPGGIDLVRTFVSAMTESSEHVAWAAGISSVAWQVILKTSPHLASGLDVMSMGPLNREELETALLQRHQRSGIPLDFAVPESGNPLLTRRVHRMRSAERRTSALRSDYFDRIHRASGGRVRTALALWVDGLELDEYTSEATVKLTLTMNEAFLEALHLEEAFALKAFLEHGSLTPEELGQVLRVTHGDAERIIERLRDLRVVEPIPMTGGGGFTGHWVERCRVRGVALPLVWRFLERRNVLHL